MQYNSPTASGQARAQPPGAGLKASQKWKRTAWHWSHKKESAERGGWPEVKVSPQHWPTAMACGKSISPSLLARRPLPPHLLLRRGSWASLLSWTFKYLVNNLSFEAWRWIWYIVCWSAYVHLSFLYYSCSMPEFDKYSIPLSSSFQYHERKICSGGE